MARILSCVSSAKRGWSSAEKIDKSSRVNWMPNWRRTKFRSKKAIHLSMRTIVSRRRLPRSETPPSGTTQNEATTSTARERRKERERERERFEERKRKVRDRPTFLYLFFYAGINGDIFKALFRNNHKKEPFKNISVERKKDVHQPLKTTTEEEERTIERTMLATDMNGKPPFERLREFQRLAIARSLAYRGLYLKKLG